MTKKSKKAPLTKNFYEKKAWEIDQLVCGIDEVGRGCLAGPLVTAAVILPPHKHHKLLKDSKILTETEKKQAYAWIRKNCWFSVGIVHHRIIDQHNIWQATILAMKKALVNLLASAPKAPHAILIDAMPLKINDIGDYSIPVYSFIKGESKSTSIAAASIVAKVTRDALMQKIDPLFPGYDLQSHKGYGTATHKNAIIAQGPTILHRVSFLGKILITTQGGHDEQQTLC